MAVFVMVENEKGEYLLQRRQGTGFLDGHFDASASGHLEYDESLQSCGTRELYEETGLVVKDEDLELTAVFQSDFEAGVRYLNAVFRTSTFSGSVHNGEPTKIDKLDWYAPKVFPSKLTVGVRVFLESLSTAEVSSYYIDAKEYKKLMGESYTEV